MSIEKTSLKNESQPSCLGAVISSLTFWFKKNFICKTIFSNGHIPEPFLHETECSIHTYRCCRCHATLGLGRWKHIPHPPNSTPEQIKQFEKYRKQRLDEIRMSVKGYK